jgi:hypothetical protein
MMTTTTTTTMKETMKMKTRMGETMSSPLKWVGAGVGE